MESNFSDDVEYSHDQQILKNILKRQFKTMTILGIDLQPISIKNSSPYYLTKHLKNLIHKNKIIISKFKITNLTS